MKKILSILLAATMISCLFAGCNGGEKKDVLKIGVLQLTKHVALDAAYEGFADGLEEAGYSEEAGNIELNYNVATGKPDECATIADQLVSAGSDLILAIATPAAQAVVNKTTSIPILVTAVTNPDGDCPGPNVSGTSDLGPIERQVQFAKELDPDMKTLGILYTSSEANSVFQAGLAKAAADKLNIPYKEYTVTAATELQSTVEGMKGQVDVCWIPTDNVCASNMPIICDAAKAANVMTVCGESGMVNTGGLATVGAVDYYELGKQTAAMAVKILKGEATVADLDIEFQAAGEDAEIIINEDVAKNYTIPDSILSKATKVKTATAE
ncbi:MAG: ABC transporter substrate-binding protein [Oscillospiraceae bacterium]|nr:ABC transporter substrate-binding protein [Oscillospiraceae bacterium]